MTLSRRGLLVLSAANGALLTTLAPPRGIAQSLQGTVDVMQFGAKGDGQADDSPAIQAALDSGASVIRFPAGTYMLGSALIPRSRQVWRGDGQAITVLALPDNGRAPYNLVQTRSSIAQLSISGLQFRGNRPLQKQRSPDGQAPFGLYLRGGCTDIDIQECTFRDLGNSSVPANRTGGGGIVLGPIPGAPDQTVENITIRHCRFAANGNVPGIYIGGGDMPGFRRRNISVLDNEFEGVPEGTRAQNCIYILAESPAAEITNVTIANNRFHVDAMVDALIELNWVRSFTITGNSGVFDSALPDSSAMLIRDGAVDGVISANSFVNRSGVERVVGIILVNFVDPGEVSGIVITGNSLRGFSRAGIAVDRGSNTVIVQGNRIEGPGNAGIRIAAASNVLVANNLLSGLQTAIQLAARTPGAPTRGVQLTGNRITDSGGDGACLIDVDGDLIDVQDLLITHTAVHSPRAGTKALASGRFRKADGNILRDNQVGSLALVAGGEEGGYETIRKADD